MFDWLVLFGCLGLIGWKRFIVFVLLVFRLFGFVGYVLASICRVWWVGWHLGSG